MDVQITAQDLVAKVGEQAAKIANLELANTSLNRALDAMFDEVKRLQGEAEAREVALEIYREKPRAIRSDVADA